MVDLKRQKQALASPEKFTEQITLQSQPPCNVIKRSITVSPAEFCFDNNSVNSSSIVPLIISLMATIFPALAAECNVVSSRFPVNCFVIFFPGAILLLVGIGTLGLGAIELRQHSRAPLPV
ncbi:unnamed protein product [Fraxinus pennsylvanica]|uniref:Uncharacterized protein n=1 Tax=Fraxinus pennsylvanica TaxID=56036 RepID=A0AAD1Z158_9LAMI|nr:unnamed protein product [Fraxinus pennsylvanica]